MCPFNEILHSNKKGTMYGQYNHRGEPHIIFGQKKSDARGYTVLFQL